MADYLVGHHPTTPGSGRTLQAVVAARCLEDSTHASMTIVPCPCKTMPRRVQPEATQSAQSIAFYSVWEN
jgi:hypothetical protein